MGRGRGASGHTVALASRYGRGRGARGHAVAVAFRLTPAVRTLPVPTAARCARRLVVIPIRAARAVAATIVRGVVIIHSQGNVTPAAVCIVSGGTGGEVATGSDEVAFAGAMAPAWTTHKTARIVVQGGLHKTDCIAGAI